MVLPGKCRLVSLHCLLLLKIIVQCTILCLPACLFVCHFICTTRVVNKRIYILNILCSFSKAEVFNVFLCFLNCTSVGHMIL